MNTPIIKDLLNRKIASLGDENAVREFFGIMRRPNKSWVETLTPGIDAAQRLIAEHIKQADQGDMSPEAIKAQADDAELMAITGKLFSGPGSSALGFLRALEKALDEHAELDMRFGISESGNRKISVTDPKDAHGDPEADQPQRVPKAIKTPTAPSQERGEANFAGSEVLDLARRLAPRLRLKGDQSGIADAQGPDIAEVLQAVLDGKWSRNVVMLLPMYDNPHPHVVYSWMAQIRRQPWLGMHYEYKTIIQRARNLLAKKFLEGEAEWSVWFDHDIVAPFGDAAFFFEPSRLNADPRYIKGEFAGAMAIERMMKAGKTIVGGVYQARLPGGPLIIQPDAVPKDKADKEWANGLRASGPRNELKQVDWVATGCALIHRKVYLDIMERFPERSTEEYFDFFGHNVGIGGEDIEFCRLAKLCGHQSWLDAGTWCGHIGNAVYWPQKP